MISGHTKFNPDGKFGMIKKLYRKSTINCADDFVEVVGKSSLQGLNKVQRYKEGEGFQYLDIKSGLEKYFKKLPNLTKYHYFLCADNLGVVKVQEEVNGEFKEFSLWKDKDRIAESIEEIRKLVFPILTPSTLPIERQKYLYEKIRPLVREEFGDIVCPQPTLDNNTDLQLEEETEE